MTKRSGLKCVLLAVVLFLTSCTALNGTATGGEQGGGGDGQGDSGNSGESGIPSELISETDSSVTVAAVASGLDPERTLISTQFDCFLYSQLDIREPAYTLQVDGSTFSIQQFEGTDVQSGSISQLETRKFYDDEVAFSGGPFDQAEAKVRFDSYGQEFSADITNSQGRLEPLSCYQSGAKSERERAAILANVPEPGTFICVSPEDNTSHELTIASDLTYTTPAGGGTFIFSELLEKSSKLGFAGGPLDGERTSYSEDPDTGVQSFSLTTSTGFLTTVASELRFVCSKTREPRPFKVYGSAAAPTPPTPSQKLTGLYYVADILVSPNESGANASYYSFSENGYIYRGTPTATSGDCSRTAPNGLPYCRSYTIEGGEIVLGPEPFEPAEEPARLPIEVNGDAPIRIDGKEMQPVTAVDPAGVVGIWENNSFSSSGFGTATSSKRQYAFDSSGIFAVDVTSLSTSDLDTGLGRSLGSINTGSNQRGTYQVDGNRLILTFESGTVETRFLFLSNTGGLAIEGILFLKVG